MNKNGKGMRSRIIADAISGMTGLGGDAISGMTEQEPLSISPAERGKGKNEEKSIRSAALRQDSEKPKIVTRIDRD